MSWENYGDVNPIEHGGIFIKADTDIECIGCYDVVTVYKAPGEDVWIVADMYVDLEDDWFEWDSVYSYSDVSEDDRDIDKVIALTQYYGSREFGIEYTVESYEGVIDVLDKLGIEVEEEN